jgi:hypothetical protein
MMEDIHSGIQTMKFSNNGSKWSDWEAFKPVVDNWDLTLYGGNPDFGWKIVYGYFKDNAGNYSRVVRDTIQYVRPEPLLETLPATEITMTSASLRGRVDSFGNPLRYYFEYGKSTTFEFATPDIEIDHDSLSFSFDFHQSGLLPGTLYFYRAVAANDKTIYYGSEQTFITIPETQYPPLFTCVPADFDTLVAPHIFEFIYCGSDSNTDDNLWFSTVQSPIGSSLDSISGYLCWNITPELAGNNPIIVSLSDGFYSVLDSSYITVAVHGDLSLNYLISAYDGALVLRYAVGFISLAPWQLVSADVSGDGIVSAYDAALILQYTIGLINELPVK